MVNGQITQYRCVNPHAWCALLHLTLVGHTQMYAPSLKPCSPGPKMGSEMGPSLRNGGVPAPLANLALKMKLQRRRLPKEGLCLFYKARGAAFKVAPEVPKPQVFVPPGNLVKTVPGPPPSYPPGSETNGVLLPWLNGGFLLRT